MEELESDKPLTRTLLNNFGQLLVLVFYTEWNQPSLQFKNNLADTIPLFGQFPQVKFIAVEAKKCPETFKKFKVEHTPTVLLTQTDKKELGRMETEDVGTVLDRVGTEGEVQRSAFEQEKQVWYPKVKSILEESAVIIFIKGTPEQPKCGFTETLLKILKENQIQFTYYDIIADEYMRYWLRQYSGWPTYPQIYIQGKLIGGLDVVKDLIAKQEFLQLVPKSSRVVSSAEKYQALLQEHPLLVFTDGFSFELKTTEIFLQKVQQSYKQSKLSVYNLSLDQGLKKHVLETTQKALPLLFKSGNLKEL